MPEGPLDDAAARPFFLWPQHLPAWMAFRDLQTQWRHGFSGPTGLDYAAVLAHLRHGLRVPHRRLRPLYEQIRSIERGVLEGYAQRDAEMRARNGKG